MALESNKYPKSPLLNKLIDFEQFGQRQSDQQRHKVMDNKVIFSECNIDQIEANRCTG